jgi:tripartite-type tricarboxylate transporter receptor subunit TctC
MHRRALLCAPLASLARPALAQGGLPSGAATIVVGFAAGGIGDSIARLVAEAARERRGGTPVVVENRPGAGGAIATAHVSRAAPDGLTIVLGSPGALLVLPHQTSVGYDPVSGLTPLGQLVAQPLPVYVRADSPLSDWGGLLAFARTNPGHLTWGTAGSRSFAEIVVETALRRERVETTSVPFRGGAEAVQALLGGHVMAVASTDYGPLLRSGQVRLLAETGPNPVPGQPGVPTFRQMGYPLCFPAGYGFLGPARMDRGAAVWWENLLRDIGRSPALATFAERYVGAVAIEDAAGYARIIREGYAAFGDVMRSG